MRAKQRVRVLVGTRKGGYIAESDENRRKWTVKGPIQPGREVFHMVADPRHPGDLYAAVNSGFWGPMLFRGANWGKSWKEIATPLMPLLSKRPPPQPDAEGNFPKHPIVNLWHVEPGPRSEPDTVFLGVDPASLYRSDDRGASWSPLPGLNEHPTRSKWNPGAGGLCLHTIALDPKNPRRMYVGISAAGTFRSDDGGEHWRPANKGVEAGFLPDPFPEFGQCVHHFALDPKDPSTIYRQDHGGIYVSRDSMDSWVRIGKSLPDGDFGFVAVTAPGVPGEAFFVPVHGESRISPSGGLQVYRWSERTRKFSPLVRGHPWRGELGTHREGMAADGLDPVGLYVGTTTGQLLYSADGGKDWAQVPYMFPGIHSVSVA